MNFDAFVRVYLGHLIGPTDFQHIPCFNSGKLKILLDLSPKNYLKYILTFKFDCSEYPCMCLFRTSKLPFMNEDPSVCSS